MSLISVAVCTYNRSQMLGGTLRALGAQCGGSAFELEIIVIDNNSTDRTREVVDEASQTSRWPIRYLFESTQGLSYARNRAIHEARGELLAFTDDDVIPESHWVETLYETFKHYHADCVGGKILPLWTETPPVWLSNPSIRKIFWGVLALLDRGSVVQEAKSGDGDFLYGANMAFQKAVFLEVGEFRTNLGNSGSTPMCGEDTDMVSRLLKAGQRVIYAPDAVVHHRVDPDRVRLSYARKRRFLGGCSQSRGIGNETCGVPRWVIRECFESGLKALWAYLRNKKELGIQHELMFWPNLGRIAGGFNFLAGKGGLQP